MNTFLKAIWKPCMSLLFGVVVFMFWATTYSAHLSYHEQLQMFMSDAEYWWERVAVPGGVADYVAEYLTQFYYYTGAGAILLALLFVYLQSMTWRMAKAEGADDAYYPLSFVPVLLLWHFMADENAMLAYVVALAFVVFAACSYLDLRSRGARVAFAVVAVPLLYWMAGPAHFIFALWLMMRESVSYIRGRNVWGGIGVFLGVGLYAVCCPLTVGMFVQYPVYRLMTGIGYYRLPVEVPLPEAVSAAAFALCPFLLLALPAVRRGAWIVCVVLLLAVALSGRAYVRLGCDMEKEEALMYDYLAYRQEWETIVSRAESQPPRHPFSMVCVNLALAKTGQMADRMFEFPQYGIEGLLPPFRGDCTSSLLASEAYYHLGLVNTAQQFTFEAMAAIPNFRMSTRCFRRLAEIALINGQYAVAEKYVKALRRTMFHKDWAEEVATYLYDDARVAAHGEWGRLRQMRHGEDFLFNEGETDTVLSLLFQQNHDNRMAYEYMMAYTMLRRDVDSFKMYYPMSRYAGYTHIPLSYQQMLAYLWSLTRQDFKEMPWSLSPTVLSSFDEFAKAYQLCDGQAEQLSVSFGHTYWYYLCKKN